MKHLGLAAVLLASLPALLTACGGDLEATFSEELIDFGVGGWMDGAPDQVESVHLINGSDTTFQVLDLRLEGPGAEAYVVGAVRSSELPFSIPGSVASELEVEFVGEPDQEDFDATLTAVLAPSAAGRKTLLDLPIRLQLSCDLDGDGDPVDVCGGADCSDADDTRSSIAQEQCDGIDNDCNGSADMDPAGEMDSDGDSYRSCEDCDESDPFTFPGAAERCDGDDNDCNGFADYDEAGEVDADGDGWLSCDDCDDSDPGLGPIGVDCPE
jgi:hypothetical protein